MTDAELADKLELHNRWRRGELDEMPLKPKELGEVIDEVVRRLRQRSGKMTPPEFVQLEMYKMLDAIAPILRSAAKGVAHDEKHVWPETLSGYAETINKLLAKARGEL